LDVSELNNIFEVKIGEVRSTVLENEYNKTKPDRKFWIRKTIGQPHQINGMNMRLQSGTTIP
jgi:hypothetical protein